MAVPQQIQDLDNLVRRANNVLFRAETVFPFDFFPDVLIVDQNKIDVITRNFFYSEQIYSILIRDIQAVHIEKSLFFSVLKVEVTGFETNPPPIRYLKNEEALRARRIIMGLVAASKERIQMGTIPQGEVLHKVEAIGRAEEPLPQQQLKQNEQERHYP